MKVAVPASMVTGVVRVLGAQIPGNFENVSYTSYLEGSVGLFRVSNHVAWITPLPSGSEVHLHVAIPDDRLGPSPESAAAEIRRGMDEAFDRLAGLTAP